MTTKLKHMVSKRKRRFVENEFDLDLTCILLQKIVTDKPVTSCNSVMNICAKIMPLGHLHSAHLAI